MQLQPPVCLAGAGDARHVVGEQLREPVGVASGLHRDDGVGADALLQCGRRVEGEDPAVVHDGYPLAELVGLLHVVGGEQDGLAFAVQLTEQVPQGEPALRIEARCRLVEEKHRGAVEDGPRHHEPLRHPPGQCVHRRLGPLGQLELVKQLIGGLPRCLRPHAEQAAVEVEVLPDGELAIEGVLLRNDPAQLFRQRRMCRDVDARDERAPGCRHHARGQHPRRRRLPGAVGSQQAKDLARPDVKVEPVNGGEVRSRIDLGQVRGVDDRHRFPSGEVRAACRGLCGTHRHTS